MTSMLVIYNRKSHKYPLFSDISSNVLIQHIFYTKFPIATASLSQCYLSVGNCLTVSNHLTDDEVTSPKSTSNLLQTNRKISISFFTVQISCMSTPCTNSYGLRGYRLCGDHGHSTSYRNQDYSSEIDFAS